MRKVTSKGKRRLHGAARGSRIAIILYALLMAVLTISNVYTNNSILWDQHSTAIVIVSSLCILWSFFPGIWISDEGLIVRQFWRTIHIPYDNLIVSSTNCESIWYRGGKSYLLHMLVIYTNERQISLAFTVSTVKRSKRMAKRLQRMVDAENNRTDVSNAG
jgi:uncharacterized membrane protein